jgi:regulator of RNase E activity RraB
MPTREDFRNQLSGDIALKKALQQQGDDENAIHIIKHQFLAKSKADLNTVSALAKLLLFESGPIQQLVNPSDEMHFTFDIISKSPTVFASIARQSILMVAIAEAHGCAYNGWETRVVLRGDNAAENGIKTNV